VVMLSRFGGWALFGAFAGGALGVTLGNYVPGYLMELGGCGAVIGLGLGIFVATIWPPRYYDKQLNHTEPKPQGW
jgi:hypothetical protein